MIGRCFELENSRLDSPDSYFNSIKKELIPKRDQLVKLLLEAGLTPIIPEGGYFMMADISKISSKFSSDATECKDSKFVKYLIKEKVRTLQFCIEGIIHSHQKKLGLGFIPTPKNPKNWVWNTIFFPLLELFNVFSFKIFEMSFNEYYIPLFFSYSFNLIEY